MLRTNRNAPNQDTNILAAFSMTKQAQELAEEHSSRPTLLAELSNCGCFSDAMMLLSFSLDDLNAIKWALTIVKEYHSVYEDNDLIAKVESWLAESNEATRNDILPGSIVEKPNAVCWLAMAAYWSGGAISENAIVDTTVSAPAGLVNEVIYSAVMLCIQQIDIDQQDSAFENAIQQGIYSLNKNA